MARPSSKTKTKQDLPVSLAVAVGLKCNNSCVFCMEQRSHGFEVVKKFVGEQIYKVLERNQGERKISFSTGEPTLNPNLLEYVKFAKDHGNKVIEITSNGRNYQDIKYCLKLIRAGATKFVISLHGNNASIHDALTRIPGSFDQTVKGIENFSMLRKHLPITLMVSHVVTKHNVKHLSKFLELMKRYYIDVVVLNICQPRGPNVEKDFFGIIPRYAEVAKELEAIVDDQPELLVSNSNNQEGRYISVMNMPFCVSSKLVSLMGFHERLVIADSEKKKKWKISSFKIKAESCSKCAYCNVCEGVFQNYIGHFGWDEFQPVIDA